MEYSSHPMGYTQHLWTLKNVFTLSENIFSDTPKITSVFRNPVTHLIFVKSLSGDAAKNLIWGVYRDMSP